MSQSPIVCDPIDSAWVAITADYDARDGGMPTDVHHVQGRHKATYADPKLLTGISHATHMAWHDRGIDIAEDANSEYSIYAGSASVTPRRAGVDLIRDALGELQEHSLGRVRT